MPPRPSDLIEGVLVERMSAEEAITVADGLPEPAWDDRPLAEACHMLLHYSVQRPGDHSNANSNFRPGASVQAVEAVGARGKPATAPACGGVYLFAHCPSGKPPDTPSADALPRQVVYIGEAKNLNSRPLTGRHHRVQRFKDLFGDTDSLFVTFASLHRTGCEDYDIQRVASGYIEAMLIWSYTKQHGHAPVLHWKDKGRIPEWVTKAVRELQASRE